MSDPNQKEVTLLRSRLEEQSDLIMILKKRNEDLQTEVIKIKEALVTAERAVEVTNGYLKTATDSKATLEEHFHTIVLNHEQMIAMKDEYKAARDKLKNQNASLEENLATQCKMFAAEREKLMAEPRLLSDELNRAKVEFRETLRLRDESIEKVTLRSTSGQTEYQTTKNTLERSLLTVKEELAGLQQRYAATTAASTETLAKLTKQLSSTQSDAKKSLELQHEALTEQLDKATAKHQDLQIAHEKLVQSHKEGTAHAIKLASELASATEKIDRFNSGAEVKNILEQLSSLTNEYTAFKKYSTEQLKREKDLNARLRHLGD